MHKLLRFESYTFIFLKKIHRKKHFNSNRTLIRQLNFLLPFKIYQWLQLTTYLSDGTRFNSQFQENGYPEKNGRYLAEKELPINTRKAPESSRYWDWLLLSNKATVLHYGNSPFIMSPLKRKIQGACPWLMASALLKGSCHLLQSWKRNFSLQITHIHYIRAFRNLQLRAPVSQIYHGFCRKKKIFGTLEGG